MSEDSIKYECIDDVECLDVEICKNNKCILRGLKKGVVVNDCKCWDTFTYIGEWIEESKCKAKFKVVEYCEGCCNESWGICEQPLLRTTCL